MRMPIAVAAGAMTIVATAVTACGAATTTVVRAPEPKPTVSKTVTGPAAVRTSRPTPTVTKTVTRAAAPASTPAASAPPAGTPAPAPAASTPSAAPATSSSAAPAGYLGDVFGGGTGNPCNFASGYQVGDCNPTGETEQQYIDNPGGAAPGTSTNAQGCYYVKMGEGYCPSTGQYVPMQDPNGLGAVAMNKPMAGAAGAAAIAVIAAGGCSGGTVTVKEVPAAATTPVTHSATPAPAAVKSAAVTPAPTVTRTVQAPAASAGAAGQAPAVGDSQYCGSPAEQGGISVNSVTSCPFAENVKSAWESSGDASSVTAVSPATGLTYTMSCTASGTGYEVCTGGDNAYVEFPVSGAAPSSGQFDDPCTQCADRALSDSVANEQVAALEAAPANDYYSPHISVDVTLTPLGDNAYSATATDADGDTGSGDTITVSADGSSWSDTGMSWSGPDVSAASWATPPVSDYS